MKTQTINKKRIDLTNFNIPTSAVRHRDISILEAIVVYLKDIQSLTYHEIAVLINRDDRTIWTCYNRASKKRI